MDDLELLWERILSRDSSQIRAAYTTLSPPERAAVMSHLQRMVTKPGWHIEQSTSARFALQTLGELKE